MLIGAGVLMLALSMTLMVDRIGARRGSGAAEQADKTPLGPEGGFELIYRDRYLFWIAVIVLLNVVNTTGQYITNRLIVSEAAAQFGGAASVVASRQFVTAFSGSITAAVNLVGLLLQLFATARVIRVIGIRGSLFVLPIIALVNYSVIAVAPILAVVRVGKILENSTDYSIQNTLRQALPADESRSEVQGEGGHRYLLHEGGRHRVGRAGRVRGDQHVDDRRIRGGQRAAGDGVARSGASDCA